MSQSPERRLYGEHLLEVISRDGTRPADRRISAERLAWARGMVEGIIAAERSGDGLAAARLGGSPADFVVDAWPVETEAGVSVDRPRAGRGQR